VSPSPATTAPHAAETGRIWSGAAQLLVKSSAPAQQVTMVLDVPRAGAYALLIDPTLGPDYGTWQLEVDGKPAGTSYDGYAARLQSPESPYQEATLDLAAGSHALTIRVTGRDRRSTGYLAGLDFIELLPINRTAS
jgi:hypothetical protein